MESPHKSKSGLTRLWRALHYSSDGLKAAYVHEHAFRQEVWLAVVLVPLGCYLGDNGITRALLVVGVLQVLVVELMNSAVEAAIDRISLDHHLLAKRAKDIGSAAVFVSLVMLAVVWGFVLLG